VGRVESKRRLPFGFACRSKKLASRSLSNELARRSASSYQLEESLNVLAGSESNIASTFCTLEISEYEVKG
jgi:hypothetical protein